MSCQKMSVNPSNDVLAPKLAACQRVQLDQECERGQRKTVCQVNVFQNEWVGSVNHVQLDAVASIKGKDIEA